MTESKTEERGAFSIATVARALKVSRTTVWTWCMEGRIDHFRLTDRAKSPIRIPRSSLLKSYPGDAGQDLVAHCDRIESAEVTGWAVRKS